MAIKYLNSINLNQNELQNAKIQNLATAPANPVKGQIFYNTTVNKLQIFDGAEWVNVGKGADTAYELPVAASDRLGGIKSGTDITVDAEGNVSINNNSHEHTIANVTGLQDALNNKVTKNTDITAGTATKITYDAKGLVTKGENLVASDIPDLSATYVNVNQKGVANGIATLDENGHVPSSQLPSYVDDVIEAENFAALPTAGEASKIYVTLDTNKTYRWGGSAYVEISASIALGTTTGTAYEGSAGAQLRTDLDNLSNTVAALDNTYATDAELKATKEGLEATQQNFNKALQFQVQTSTIYGNGEQNAFLVEYQTGNNSAYELVPRIVQIFDSNYNLVMTDIKIQNNNISVTFGTTPEIGEEFIVHICCEVRQAH